MNVFSEAKMTPNPTLTPTHRPYSQVAHDTIHRHKYSTGWYNYAFVGDSHMINWETVAAKEYKSLCHGRTIANMSVLGDQIEHVLWRINPIRSILKTAKITSAVVLMVGTHNLPSTSPVHIAEGIHNVIDTIKTQVKLPIHVMLLPYRKDVLREIVDETNAHICAKSFKGVTYHDPWWNFDDSCYQEDGVHFNQKGYAKWLKFFDELLASGSGVESVCAVRPIESVQKLTTSNYTPSRYTARYRSTTDVQSLWYKSNV